MNEKKFKLIVAIFLNISTTPLYCIDQINRNQNSYIQAASSLNQLPNLVTGSYILIDASAADPIKNFETAPNNTGVICKNAGTYLICSGTQIGVTAEGVGGYLDSWYELNNQPVPYSNSRQYVNQNSKIALATNVFIMKLKENDFFGAKFIASGPNIGLICIKNLPNGEPDILSFGLTLLKID